MSVAESLASRLLRGPRDRNVVVGPALWHPDGGAYFMAVFGRRGRSLRAECVRPAPGADIEAVRSALLASFAEHPRMVVHDFDDEGESIARCEELWPCSQISTIRRQLEIGKAKVRGALADLTSSPP